jgi:hypothetical protein
MNVSYDALSWLKIPLPEKTIKIGEYGNYDAIKTDNC